MICLRKVVFLGLVLNWQVLMLIGALWILSELRQERIELVIKTPKEPYGIFELNTIGGECYIGGQRWGMELPLHFITCVLAVWPVAHAVKKIRRGREKGFVPSNLGKGDVNELGGLKGTSLIIDQPG